MVTNKILNTERLMKKIKGNRETLIGLEADMLIIFKFPTTSFSPQA